MRIQISLVNSQIINQCTFIELSRDSYSHPIDINYYKNEFRQLCNWTRIQVVFIIVYNYVFPFLPNNIY